jgi:hypothetical protein
VGPAEPLPCHRVDPILGELESKVGGMSNAGAYILGENFQADNLNQLFCLKIGEVEVSFWERSLGGGRVSIPFELARGWAIDNGHHRGQKRGHQGGGLLNTSPSCLGCRDLY